MMHKVYIWKQGTQHAGEQAVGPVDGGTTEFYGTTSALRNYAKECDHDLFMVEMVNPTDEEWLDYYKGTANTLRRVADELDDAK